MIENRDSNGSLIEGMFKGLDLSKQEISYLFIQLEAAIRKDGSAESREYVAEYTDGKFDYNNGERIPLREEVDYIIKAIIPLNFVKRIEVKLFNNKIHFVEVKAMIDTQTGYCCASFRYQREILEENEYSAP